RLRVVLATGLLNLLALFAVLAVGLSLFLEPHVVTSSIHLGSAPKWDDLIFGLVVATVALTGIEAASGFAGDVQAATGELRRLVTFGTALVLIVFVGVSAVALMGVPVSGTSTALGTRYIEAPVLGLIKQFDPHWLEQTMRWVIGIVGS